VRRLPFGSVGCRQIRRRCARGGSNVPRYYFHFSDGKRQFTDGSGVELNGMAAARAYAAKQVRELRVAMCHPHIQDLSGWSMLPYVPHLRSGLRPSGNPAPAVVALFADICIYFFP
jgi:Domain of unknown function (DUF6894)